MTKEKLKQEAEKWLRKFLLCNDCKRKCHCIELNAYCEEQVLKAYIDSAEPREKRIADLEKENAELKGLVNQYKASKCGSISLVNRNMIMFDQLNKAKDIIKNLMVYVPVDLKEYEEAKQFLSEVEK